VGARVGLDALDSAGNENTDLQPVDESRSQTEIHPTGYGVGPSTSSVGVGAHTQPPHSTIFLTLCKELLKMDRLVHLGLKYGIHFFLRFGYVISHTTQTPFPSLLKAKFSLSLFGSGQST